MTFANNDPDRLPPPGKALRNESRIRAIRDLYSGRRCFIVGNGPSLNRMDLRPLAGEFTICMNGLVLTPLWDIIQPKCFMAINPPHVLNSKFFKDDIIGTLRNYPSVHKFFHLRFSEDAGVTDLIDGLENAYYLKFDHINRLLKQRRFLFDLTGYLLAADSTTLIQTAIPIAVYMGSREIYVLGCDCDYDLETLEGNHFYSESSIPSNWEVCERSLDLYRDYWRQHDYHNLMMQEWALTEHCLWRQGIAIFNAGVGGKLDLLDRVDFREVVSRSDFACGPAATEQAIETG